MTRLTTGVYRIRNVVNGKVYIGSAARSFRARWADHRKRLRSGSHPNQHLQAAWLKHGEQAFAFEIVEPCDPRFVIAYEQVFIDHYRSTDRLFGYNLSPTAGSCRGVKHTIETRARNSARQRLRPPPSEETRARISKAHQGRKNTPETIAKMRESARRRVDEDFRKQMSARVRGRKWTPEQRAKLIEARRNRPPVSDATRAKLSAASVGRKHSKESINKMSAAMSGRKASLEHRAKLSASHKGKTPSLETREKMSAAMRGRQFSQNHIDHLREAAYAKRRLSHELVVDMRKSGMTQQAIADHFGVSSRTVFVILKKAGLTRSYTTRPVELVTSIDQLGEGRVPSATSYLPIVP